MPSLPKNVFTLPVERGYRRSVCSRCKRALTSLPPCVCVCVCPVPGDAWSAIVQHHLWPWTTAWERQIAPRHRLVQRGTSPRFSEGQTQVSFRLTGTETGSGLEGLTDRFWLKDMSVSEVNDTLKGLPLIIQVQAHWMCIRDNLRGNYASLSRIYGLNCGCATGKNSIDSVFVVFWYFWARERFVFPLINSGWKGDLILVLLWEILEGFSNNGCLDGQEIRNTNVIKN